MNVIKRDGQLAEFTPEKIRLAVLNCLLDTEGLKKPGAPVATGEISNRLHQQAEEITTMVVDTIVSRATARDTDVVHIEDVQDYVELALMRQGMHKAAREYILYREARAEERAAQEKQDDTTQTTIEVVTADGSRKPLDIGWVRGILAEAAEGLDVEASDLEKAFERNVFSGMPESGVIQAAVLAARMLIDKDPDYGKVAARLLQVQLRDEAIALVGLDPVRSHKEMVDAYPEYFNAYIQKGIEVGRIAPELGQFDLERLGKALQGNRDMNFTYLGIQTLYDRYFLHEDGVRYELPQAFFMRVAMGLAIREIDREEKAIEFYNVLSSFDFMSSTPTLFNSGTIRPQLSSCYLTTVPDHLDGIFSAIKDDAMLSKYAGGLGNDWTPVRAMGAHIKGTNGQSQGVVPFMKVANDTAVAVNQGGKRRGAICAYLETWHLDIEDFLDLRKNTGDERRRTHDMNTANWVPDLFMKRVAEKQDWTLFSPDETPDLHDLSGAEFEEAYTAYEKKARDGEMKQYRTVKAEELWRKMLTMLFETGHPWIAFKDPCNVRYTNQHVGVVHSSNLCTEITLHTNENEIAVCNLGSINLARHMRDGELNMVKLKETVKTAIRMLDNVIDINLYSVPQARKSNLQHRPIGLGLMGFQDALFDQGIPYASEEAVEFADKSMEAISYFAIEASSALAAERGAYATFQGSLWSQGILPIDSLKMLANERGDYLQVDETQSLDWDALREKVRHGMRNSNVMAIAPTATISNICGVTQSIEPTYQNLFVKSNLSGEFTVVNQHLVDNLKELGIWDEAMVADLKHYDGAVTNIERIPENLRALYATAFEIDSRWLIEAASRRQKWLDQAISLNLYLAQPSGKALDSLYKLAWVRGLKTTYYLRSLGATAVEKTAEATSKPAFKAATDAVAFKVPEFVEACGDGGCQ